jgi:hypothetical protein
LAVGIVLIAVGGVWILQGAGFLKGSFMTGEGTWLWIGIATVIVGFVVVRASRRARPND